MLQDAQLVVDASPDALRVWGRVKDALRHRMVGRHI
jgi:hypothetical protein